MKTNFKVGDVVKIIANNNSHGLTIGNTYEVCKVIDNTELWYQRLRLIEDSGFIIRSTDVELVKAESKDNSGYRGFKVFVSTMRGNALTKEYEFSTRLSAIKKATELVLNNTSSVFDLLIGVAYYDANGMHPIDRCEWTDILVSGFGGVQLDLETKEYSKFETTR